MTSNALIENLKELSAVPGPVGREELVQNFMKDRLEKYVDSTKEDGLGNLVAHIEGVGSTIALAAHADEFGFIVTEVTENGYVRFDMNTAATVPDRYLPGTHVEVLGDNGNVKGIVGIRGGHLLTREEKSKSWRLKDVFIDLGLSYDDCESKGIHPGTPIIFDSPVIQHGSLLSGKAMDDRVGLAIILQIAQYFKEESEKNPNLLLLSTVQEEISLLGAHAVSQVPPLPSKPDMAIILEIGLAGDIPGVKGLDVPIKTKLGAGPVIVHKDGRMHFSSLLNGEIKKISDKKGIPLQHAVYRRVGTDAHAIASRLGCKTAVIGVPCRYTHSPFETIHPGDLLTTFNLLTEFLRKAR